MGEKFNEIKISIVGVIAIIYAFLANIFGALTPLLIITLIAMFADLITRIYAACVRPDERPESKKVMKGLYKKVGLCLLIMLALMVDKALLILASVLGINIVAKILVTALVMAYILVREIISNAENLQHAGIELPTFLIKVLGIAKDKIDNAGDAIVGGGDGDKV
ncbi:phage holin family protein [Sedimentibacter hydroxybenzoicus DSM 7310]|uniref:Phage holin family protein n=1 Tax=Sedimentibacter hydroxybenzoicus DSM 7310 TaxID=1123245 RepID=A0A974BJ53_SEDHY|nr:phage holin family protein [Sedimentibacter hydroxybenzoicus]NYB73846.1 phage holin family protein [Sedimentibacter hydroxybenzoicus DSM 7310]